MAKVDIPYMFPFLFFPDETQAATLAQNYLSGTRPQMGLTRVGFHGKPALCMAPTPDGLRIGRHPFLLLLQVAWQTDKLVFCHCLPDVPKVGHLGGHVCDLGPVCDQLQTSMSTLLQEALSSTARR